MLVVVLMNAPNQLITLTHNDPVSTHYRGLIKNNCKAITVYTLKRRSADCDE